MDNRGFQSILDTIISVNNHSEERLKKLAEDINDKYYNDIEL